MTLTHHTIRLMPSIADIAAAEWNVCANGADPGTDPGGGKALNELKLTSEDNLSPNLPTRGNYYNPFISHEFLYSLEASKSIGGRTGWQPRHIVVETKDGAIAGVVPCYLKGHSRGEYVFDHGWAEAFERAGGDYYPKLQIAVPFTPVTGPRFLVRAGPSVERIRAALTDAVVSVTEQFGLSSAHATFLTRNEWDRLESRGFLLRNDQQFHWENNGYHRFDDFLAALASRKRKTIRRERKEALAAGIDIHWLTGSDLTESIWDAFFGFYMDTGSRKWGQPYLTRAFFSLVGASMANRIVLMMAKRAGRWIAGAINFLGHDAIYGRNWGAVEHHPFLHFELCYYQAIDYAIHHRLRRVEAGAQGEHKLARGYRPVTTYSAHFIANPALRRAIADYLAHERAYVAAASEELAAAVPFRKDLVEHD
jgi:hypothetical protein